MRSRRSVRRFRPEPVSPQILNRVLETAAAAPSAHNRQPWRFVVLASPAARERLAEAMGVAFLRDLLAGGLSRETAQAQVARSRARIYQAPVAVVLCLTMAEMDTYPDAARQRLEHWMAVQSVALAGGAMLFAAHAEGLGGVWVCAPLFAQDVVAQTLDLPAGWEPQGMVLMGYPAMVPEARPRKPLAEVARYL